MRTWITADTHFGHQGICNFLRDDGSKVRPWAWAQDMDKELIARWNAAVGKEDKVYHLGDVAFSNRHLQIMWHLNGRKVLIRGNHDRLKLSQYAQHFKDVRGVHVLDKYILSHIPVHPGSKSSFKGNIHGHTHVNDVLDAHGKPDPWYFNACVEQTDYRPVLFDEIRKRLGGGE